MPMQPRILKRRDIPSLAKYINSGKCEKVVLMLGAGVSTAAGIPDFRSPKTGLYSNLARLKLPHPEAVFEIYFFRQNPEPFYTLAHELYPGRFRPTLTHSFVRLLADKGLLHQCFTQNIDTLERRAGVPADKVIEAHGSFATQRCIDCKEPYDDVRMKKHILAKNIPRCDRCKGLVKPDIVFFGESLPDEFIDAVPQVSEADLLIVIGTSLTVQPFASLAGMAPSHCPRVLVNLDRVGDFGRNPDDVVLLGKCDEIIRDLAKELGWLDELMELWNATEESVEDGAKDEKTEGKSASDKGKKAGHLTADEEVEQLTEAIEHCLAVSDKEPEAEEVVTQTSEHLANQEEVVDVPKLIPEPSDEDDTTLVVKGKESDNESGGKDKLEHKDIPVPSVFL